MEKKKLYALLVGITDYPSPVRPLSACLDDVEKIATYLQEEEGQHYDIAIEKLTNEGATKSAVVEQFTTHLGQAGPADVALFYFSGHGTQEEADTTFWTNESNERLECLICFDSVNEEDNYYQLLADKELRWMINKVADKGAHVVTIFDCCNSGDNTRNSWLGENPAVQEERRYFPTTTRSARKAFPRRALTDFAFWSELEPKYQGGQSLEALLPEGRHVQMAACRSDESAWESDGKGIFTHNLLEVLRRSKGAVTYYDLKSRIQHYIRNEFSQSPQIYASGDSSDLFQTFLGKQAESKPLYGNVIYSTREDGGKEWIIDMGALRGVSERAGKIAVEVGDQTINASVEKVYQKYTALTFGATDQAKLNTQETYQGYVADFFSTPVGIYLHQVVENEDGVNWLKEALEKVRNVNLLDQETGADYTLLLTENHYEIVLPGKENYGRPLVRREVIEERGAKLTANYLKEIAQWSYIKNLQNENTIIFSKFPLEIEIWEVMEDGSEEPVPIEQDRIRLPYRQKTFKTKRGLVDRVGQRLKMRLTNQTDDQVFVSALFMGMDFSCTPALLKPHVKPLLPGVGFFVCDHRIDPSIIPLRREDYIKHGNWPMEESYLKLIVSTDEAALSEAVTHFQLNGLPPPDMRDSTRSSFMEEEDVTISDWITKVIQLQLVNPDFVPES